MGNAGVRVFDAATRTLTIGRSQTCDIVFDADPSVSRRHACIERFDGNLRVRDLRSRNGTFLNGMKLTKATRRSACEARRCVRAAQWSGRVVGDQLDFAWPPGFVEPRFQRAVEPQEAEPALAGDRLDPVRLVARWLLWAEIEVD